MKKIIFQNESGAWGSRSGTEYLPKQVEVSGLFVLTHGRLEGALMLDEHLTNADIVSATKVTYSAVADLIFEYLGSEELRTRELRYMAFQKLAEIFTVALEGVHETSGAAFVRETDGRTEICLRGDRWMLSPDAQRVQAQWIREGYSHVGVRNTDGTVYPCNEIDIPRGGLDGYLSIFDVQVPRELARSIEEGYGYS